MKARILLLPGDGVGPEVVAQSRRVLEAVGRLHGHDLALVEGLIGEAARAVSGSSLPPETVAACRVCDAVLVGAVAGPAGGEARRGLRALCRAFELSTNLLPVRPHPALRRLAPVRADVLAGVDLLLVRDRDAAERRLPDEDALPPVVRAAFRAAARRRSRLTAVEPADRRLARGQWRGLVERLTEAHPEVAVERVDADTCLRRLDERPARLDVILACGSGLEALRHRLGGLAGSPGLLASATLGAGTFGIHEPAHGAAEALAGRGRANPTAALLATALLLRHSLELEREAQAVETAVHEALGAGRHTPDIARDPGSAVSTAALADAVLARLGEAADRASGRA